MLERLIEFMIPPHKRGSDEVVTALFERIWQDAAEDISQEWGKGNDQVVKNIKKLCEVWFSVGYHTARRLSRD